MILGTHQLTTLQPDRSKGGLPKEEYTNAPYVGESIFTMLLPYTYGPRTPLSATPTLDEVRAYFYFNVPAYQDPADFSLNTHRFTFVPPDRWSYTTYACNMKCFNRELRYPFAMPDGASNTLAFAQTYAACGAGGGDCFRHWSYFYTDPPEHHATSRRATLADSSIIRDLQPIRDPVGGLTVCSIRGLTFQTRPPLEEADARMAQTPYHAGLPIALFDGSVRTLSPNISESTYWALFTPDGGEVPGDL